MVYFDRRKMKIKTLEIRRIIMLLLEEIYKSHKAQNSAHFNLRIHRGLGWFKKSSSLDGSRCKAS
jgi:hypothetical protein